MARLKAVPAACGAPHRAALEAVRIDLKHRFLERDDVVDGILAALLCRQHVLLLGSPGTAKSALASATAASIEGARFFGWLLTKFTTPEEIYGPISLSALQLDRVARITTGKLPEAHLGMLDECWKASSAILNTLLTLMNERVFYNDGKAVACPLQTVIGASNELPEGNELEALFDRFLVRFWVPYLHDAATIRTLLTAPQPAASGSMTRDDLVLCQQEASLVNLPDLIVDAVIAIKQRTEEQGFRSSDRRWQQLMFLLRAHAYLEGRDEVVEDDLDLLTDCLWREPKDRPALAAIVGQVGNPLNVRATEILDAAREAAVSLGSINPQGPDARAEWLKQASLVESRLGDMEVELGKLAAENSNRNLRRVREAAGVVRQMKAALTKRVATAYGL